MSIQRVPLSTWHLERRGRYWHIVRPQFFTLTKAKERGPYGSITSACLMIARELIREALGRKP